MSTSTSVYSSASSSSSKLSSPAGTSSRFPLNSASPYKPSMELRESTCSAYSCSTCGDGGYGSSGSDSDDECTTPNSSPEIKAADSRKGKGKVTAFDLSASFSGFNLDDVTEEWSVPVVPVSPPSPDLALPALPPSAACAPPSAAPSSTSPSSSTSSRAAAHPRPAPDSPPTRAVVEAEEEGRGRSRFPRLLWRSEIDLNSLTVLRDYYTRVEGGPLPVLKSGMSDREVRRWSMKIEDAGL